MDELEEERDEINGEEEGGDGGRRLDEKEAHLVGMEEVDREEAMLLGGENCERLLEREKYPEDTGAAKESNDATARPGIEDAAEGDSHNP